MMTNLISNMEDERYSFSTSPDADNSKWMMCDLLKSKTHLPFIIFALTKDCVSDDNGPRLRFAIHEGDVVHTSTELKSVFFGQTYSKTLHEINPIDKMKLFEFIDKNRQALLDFCNVKINRADFEERIVPWDDK